MWRDLSGRIKQMEEEKEEALRTGEEEGIGYPQALGGFWE